MLKTYQEGKNVSSLKSQEAADFLGVSVSWLNKSRMRGDGPVYLKLGGSVRYAIPDLEAWMAGQRRTAIYDFVNDNERARAAA
ncbi:helix-turn-helix domain-containing protein [Mesorhizobium sp. SP-1A]|uniref:helix-turn-helix transcriptional regulator n=1 Tax=Mesorhizobium sp. SP-1A TaxID=3077840 RepID=UPI0028F70E73|nr:helix-turn-helix domain-containing protein [Mesorhizobium sp. SP-1A]